MNRIFFSMHHMSSGPLSSAVVAIRMMNSHRFMTNHSEKTCHSSATLQSSSSEGGTSDEELLKVDTLEAKHSISHPYRKDPDTSRLLAKDLSCPYLNMQSPRTAMDLGRSHLLHTIVEDRIRASS